MEDIKNIEAENAKNDAPKPGTKDALKAENDALRAELAALKAKQEAMEGESKTPVAAAAPDPGPKMVKVRIPRTKKDEEDVFASVNNYTCIVKRGVEVEVPDFIAEVLLHQEEMLEEIMLFEDAQQNKNK